MIKFRAYSFSENKMYSAIDLLNNKNFYFEQNENGELIGNSVIDPDGNRESLLLMPFTGLYDKNGKEIYELDFITGRATPILVKYRAPEFKFIYRPGNYYWVGYFCAVGWGDIGDVEIIGNALENKEISKDYEKFIYGKNI